MSCNGCRVLRKGCNDNCVLRPCLQWIDSADAQGNATVFVAKFFGRAGLMGFIGAVPEDQRAALFQSLLYEACGRTVNPVHGALGLLWSGKWNVCEAAVETVLKGGGSLKPTPQGLLQAAVAAPTNAFPRNGTSVGGAVSAAAAAAAATGAATATAAAAAAQVQEGPGLGPAAPSVPRSSPRPSRARSSFTAHHSLSAHSQANVDEVRHAAGVGVVPMSAMHELDNASEISSAGTGTGTTSRLMTVEAAAEELRRRDLSVRQDWDMHHHHHQQRRPQGASVAQEGKENGEWRMLQQPSSCALDISRASWKESSWKAATVPSPLWSASDVPAQHQSLPPAGLHHALESTRVKREHLDMSDQLVEARRVQPRLVLQLHPNLSIKDHQPCQEWDASEAEGRGTCGNYAKAAPVELNLCLNSAFPSKPKEQQPQQHRKPGGGGGGGGRVSSPSCGSVNSEGSVTSLHSSKCMSPWTLQIATELQSNRQLLPLLR